MRRTAYILSVFVLAGCTSHPATVEKTGPLVPSEVSLETSVQQLVITDQAHAAWEIYDLPTRTLLWQMDTAAFNIPASRRKWFRLPDEAKPVLDASCLLVTASGGGVALIDIAERSILFYAHPAGNPHSAELLPDGNIVVASSTGNCLTVYDPGKGGYVKGYVSRTTLASAHNVVWDKRRSCLWSAAEENLNQYSYAAGVLTLEETIALPPGSGDAHDLAPVYGTDRLVVTTGYRCFLFAPSDATFVTAASFQQEALKSYTSGPAGFPQLCTRPTESWWARDVVGFSDGIARIQWTDREVYKARYRVHCPFSY